MKRFSLYTFALVFLSLTLTSCELFEGVFKAGMGVGIFIVIAILALIIWIISRFRK
ncbi:hypothetical protein [Flavobacterium sp.]|uniref:hypothetical protein n=1 Tax=Flavobacterium sp. TaxID=239 RepID=UPI0025B83E47|nr:hypothetical protein [Flavobacterium sp.]